MSIANHIIDKDYGMGGDFSGIGFVIQIFVIGLPMIIFFNNYGEKKYSKQLSKDVSYDFFENCGMLNFFMYVLRAVSLVLERISFYFLPSLLVQYDRLILTQEDKKEREIISIIVSVLMVGIFLYRYYKGVRSGVFTFFWE